MHNLKIGDISCKQNISQYIKSHKEKGGIVLMSSHDTLELALCDQWYIMKEGKIAAAVRKEDVETGSKKLEDIFFEITEENEKLKERHGGV